MDLLKMYSLLKMGFSIAMLVYQRVFLGIPKIQKMKTFPNPNPRAPEIQR